MSEDQSRDFDIGTIEVTSNKAQTCEIGNLICQSNTRDHSGYPHLRSRMRVTKTEKYWVRGHFLRTRKIDD